MKILSCYITGFGKFSNQSFTFADLTVIKEDNGWGKTTLAAFIRCMLFGMSAGRGKAVEENARAHYAPWQGGTYGGTLTFAVGGDTYRVERVFGKTPMQDVGRVYDKNNMQRFEFGERAERLGETLFGVDADSYARSVYIPQGEIETGGFSEDIKSRLLALLSNGGNGETSAERALQKLDDADKKLRAKRRPAKGKLDEIDERLEEIARQKDDADKNALLARQLRAQAAQIEQDIAACNQKLEELDRRIESVSRRNELAAARSAHARLTAAKDELTRLRAFFGEHDPTALNVDGLQTAVNELYQCKERLREIEGQLSVPITGEEGELRAQITACEKTLSSYDEILSKTEKKSAKPKGKKIVPKVTRRMRWLLILSVTAAIVGAALAGTLFALGLALLGAGAVGMLVGFFCILPRREKVGKAAQEDTSAQDEISRLYDETYAELTNLQRRLAALTGGDEGAPITDRAAMENERKELCEKIRVKEGSVAAFLQNFAFGQIYDYRASLDQLRENIERYQTVRGDVQEYERSLQGYSVDEIFAANPEEMGDVSALKAQKLAWSQKKEALTGQRSEQIADAENLERRLDRAALVAEENMLTEEKARLEKRHAAILAARTILLRAKENMALRYLDPVEKGCRHYLGVLGGAENLRFAADGTPVYEAFGAYRPLGYYSVGSKELVGLCTRVALADAIFQKQPPVLIFDDPFVNLDDEKTERAKALVKELSKRYQIIYLTCKSERKI